MKSILFSLVWLSSVAALGAGKEDVCDWGFAAPPTYQCGGKTYVYGDPLCSSGWYHNVFCEERFETTGKACEDDNSAATIACYNKVIANAEHPRLKPPAGQSAPAKPQTFCNWGVVAPASYLCKGVRYVYGSAACSDGMYSKMFCNEKFSQSGKECTGDESAATNACIAEIKADHVQRSDGVSPEFRTQGVK